MTPDIETGNTTGIGSEQAPAEAAQAPDKALSAKRRARRVAIWTVVLVAFAALATGSMLYTEQSSFCPTCHEMSPYYNAWAASAHGDEAGCVDCHVDPGVMAHLAHKPAALKEVWDHFFGSTKFPNYTAEVPDSRCVTCHKTIPEKSVGTTLFSHKQHQTKAGCKECHWQAGHTVTLVALKSAGILNASATTPTVGGLKPSAAPGHKAVVCQDCHDQAAMKCSTCHKAPHESRGECSMCHIPGAGFTSVHPTSTDCASCHDAPAKHYGDDCTMCHKPTIPFDKTTYDHASPAQCSTCHKAPAGHYGTNCAGCHSPSVQFSKTVYRHVAGSNCASCHRPPSGHFGSTCASCHTPSVPFAKTVYRHNTSAKCSSCHHAPSSHYGTDCGSCHTPSVPFAKTIFHHVAGSTCTKCHKRPSNHYTATCSTCHDPSVPFSKTVFKHTSATNCASCHTAPGNHFGTDCASCHKPSVPFAKATFKHPSTGEHSYRSFACVKCHPNNYQTAYCSCHNGNPPKD